VITINLRPGTRRAVKSGGSAFAGVGSRLKQMGSGVRDPFLMGAVALSAVVVLGAGYLWIRTASRLSALDPQIEEARAEHDRYKAFMRQKLAAERARDSILGQIGAISTIYRERYIWPHMLDDVGASLPEGTWLTEISAVAYAPTVDTTIAWRPSFRILGKTGDLANYTTFMRRLEASPWIENVLPIEAKTVIEGNRAMTAFIIQATYAEADSSMIHSVPILESVGGN
jgi:Tfp pilus assembly protein PilN